MVVVGAMSVCVVASVSSPGSRPCRGNPPQILPKQVRGDDTVNRASVTLGPPGRRTARVPHHNQLPCRQGTCCKVAAREQTPWGLAFHRKHYRDCFYVGGSAVRRVQRCTLAANGVRMVWQGTGKTICCRDRFIEAFPGPLTPPWLWLGMVWLWVSEPPVAPGVDASLGSLPSHRPGLVYVGSFADTCPSAISQPAGTLT